MNRETRSTLLNIGGFIVGIALIILVETSACSSRTSSNYLSKEEQLRSDYEFQLKKDTEQAYSEGYQDGHSDGVEEATKEWYSRGYDEGYKEGHDNGYSLGFEESRHQVLDYLYEPILHDYGFNIDGYFDLLPGLP
jgi:hypothetical protein